MITTCTPDARCPRHLANGGTPSDIDPCGVLTEEHIELAQARVSAFAPVACGIVDALAEQLLARERELAEARTEIVAIRERAKDAEESTFRSAQERDALRAELARLRARDLPREHGPTCCCADCAGKG